MATTPGSRNSSRRATPGSTTTCFTSSQGRSRRPALVRVGARAGRSRPGGTRAWRDRLKDGISFHTFVQYAFETQWQALRAACREHGVMLMGDVPIFVAHDSADVWRGPTCFTWTSTASRRSSPACRPTISARPASSGETRSTSGRPTPRRTTLVGRRGSGAARPGSTSSGSTTSAASRPTGRSPPDRRPRRRAAGCPGRDVQFFEAIRRRAGLAAAGRRGPGLDHARRRSAARRVRPARHAGPPVRLRRRPGRGEAPAAPLHAALRRLHRHARQRHDQRLVHSTDVATTQSPRGDRGRASVRPALS